MRAIRLLGVTGVLSAVLVLAPNAFAAGHWYVRTAISYNAVSNHSWDSPSGSVSTVSKGGPGIDLALGRDLGRVWAGGGIRGEFELSWKYNDVDYFTQGGTQLTGTTGHTRALAFMYNLINDFRPESSFDPYLGIGIGYADVYYGDYYGFNPNTRTESSLSSGDSRFAYQVLAGVKLNLSHSLALDLAYKWFVLSDPSLHEPYSAGHGTFTSSYRTSSAMLGLDWMF